MPSDDAEVDSAASRPAPADPQLTGLAGILVWTSADRFDAMATFYRDTLGLPVRTDRDQHLAFEWPAHPGVRLTLVVHSEISGAARDPLRLMVNLAVGDIRACCRALQDRGVTFTRMPAQEPWGGWIATFADPDGNVVQLLQQAASPSP